MAKEGDNDAYFTPARHSLWELSAWGNTGWWDAVGMYVKPPPAATDSMW